MVLRSTPVTRPISRWLAPPCSRVRIVTRKCDFKTFNSSLPLQNEGSSVTSRRHLALGADRRPFSSGVEEFQVLTGGGVWVAAGALGPFRCFGTKMYWQNCRTATEKFRSPHAYAAAMNSARRKAPRP
jgi:hypothetical protein